MLSGKAHIDSANKGVTDLDDQRIGFLLNSVIDRVAIFGSGLSCIEWHNADGTLASQG
jgi:hypothetical protein